MEPVRQIDDGIKLDSIQLGQLTNHLQTFSQKYVLSTDKTAIIYDGNSIMPDADALRDLDNWLLKARQSETFLNEICPEERPIDEILFETKSYADIIWYLECTDSDLAEELEAAGVDVATLYLKPELLKAIADIWLSDYGGGELDERMESAIRDVLMPKDDDSEHKGENTNDSKRIAGSSS